jgi:hypothetical protein
MRKEDNVKQGVRGKVKGKNILENTPVPYL